MDERVKDSKPQEERLNEEGKINSRDMVAGTLQRSENYSPSGSKASRAGRGPSAFEIRENLSRSILAPSSIAVNSRTPRADDQSMSNRRASVSKSRTGSRTGSRKQSADEGRIGDWREARRSSAESLKSKQSRVIAPQEDILLKRKRASVELNEQELAILHLRFQTWPALRSYTYFIIESSKFSATMLSIIIFNTVMITLQLDKEMVIRYGYYFVVIDNLLLGIYVTELILKLYVWRSMFFLSGWNNFDFFIVLTSMIEVVSFVLIGQTAGVDPRLLRLLRVFRAVRAIRALRVLRTITFLKSLQVIVNTLLRSIPAMGSIFSLLALITYIFAIIGTDRYGKTMPNAFGTVSRSAFSLFQMLTMDNWFQFYTDGHEREPSLIFYLVVFIVFEAFILVNLFVAVIVSNLEESQNSQSRAKERLRGKAAQGLARNLALASVNEIEDSRKSDRIPDFVSRDDTAGKYPEVLKRRRLQSQAFLLQSALESNTEYYEQLEGINVRLMKILQIQESRNKEQLETFRMLRGKSPVRQGRGRH